MNIFIDNNDLEEQYGEQKYQEYLEKENKQMKQDITTMNKEIERLNNNWNELEKELEDMATLKTDEYGNTRKITHIDINWLLYKIKKLKGADKE